MLKNTGEICMIFVQDKNKEDGIRCIDIGNYFITTAGKKCVVTTIDLAMKYSHLIKEEIYIIKKS